MMVIIFWNRHIRESDTDRSGLRLFISVEMKLSITGYMLFFSLGAIGLAIIKDRKIIH